MMKITMMRITTYKLKEHFSNYEGYLSNPPEDKVLAGVCDYINDSNFEMIFRKFGHRYLLIVLSLLEEQDMWAECKLAIDVIEKYNRKYNEKFPTHINQTKSIY